MYAVIQDGGREYRVAKDDVVDIDLRKELNPGDEIIFPKVLLVRKSEDEVLVGCPTLEGVKVLGEVEGTVKGDKLIAFKYKRRKGYHRKKGHRQSYTQVRIRDIAV